MTQATHATGKILRHAHNFEQRSSVVYALPLPFHVVILHGRPARERKKVLIAPCATGFCQTSMLVHVPAGTEMWQSQRDFDQSGSIIA